MALVGDGELAVTEGVPQLDGAVARAGDNLAVVGGEGDGQNIVVVADEAAGGGAGGQLPESQGLVPRGGQGVGAVGGDNLSKFNPSACILLVSSPKTLPPLVFKSTQRFGRYVRSQRRCGSGRAETSWGNRTGTHRE